MANPTTPVNQVKLVTPVTGTPLSVDGVVIRVLSVDIGVVVGVIVGVGVTVADGVASNAGSPSAAYAVDTENALSSTCSIPEASI